MSAALVSAAEDDDLTEATIFCASLGVSNLFDNRVFTSLKSKTARRDLVYALWRAAIQTGKVGA